VPPVTTTRTIPRANMFTLTIIGRGVPVMPMEPMAGGNIVIMTQHHPMSDKLTYYCDKSRHLVCMPYNVANLHQMAADLDIKRCWFHRNASYAHYDIPKRRIQEITDKCKLVTSRVILSIVKGQFKEVSHES